jgi:UDP-2,3-diacylglucosamine hydrolase
VSALPPLNPPLPSVQAPQQWQRIDFISDLHLDASEPTTFEAWAQHMAHTPADALFILGDLFEVWVGDDTQDPFALQCMAVLQRTAQRMPVYFMCGNRDFLVGDALLKATGMQGLRDPTVLHIDTTTDANPAAMGSLTLASSKASDNNPPPLRLLLSHGDSLCLGDTDYLAFRAQVRQPAWQQQFLAQPLAERQAFARRLREQSEARKKTHTDYADVDHPAAHTWLHAAQASVFLHGHTHKPAVHDLGHGLTRWVLSDWHADTQPPRLEVLSWLRNQEKSPTRGLCRLPLSHS